MEASRLAEIQRSLRTLVEWYSHNMRLLEDTLRLLEEEPPPGNKPFGQTCPPPKGHASTALVINARHLSVTHQSKTCFLGNGLPFKILSRLAQEPNAYVSHEELVKDVWHDDYVSDAAIRSAVKTLRNKLRQHDLADLADAVDGSIPGHYGLRLPS